MLQQALCETSVSIIRNIHVCFKCISDRERVIIQSKINEIKKKVVM